jgi:hypothetical protein
VNSRLKRSIAKRRWSANVFNYLDFQLLTLNGYFGLRDDEEMASLRLSKCQKRGIRDGRRQASSRPAGCVQCEPAQLNIISLQDGSHAGLATLSLLPILAAPVTFWKDHKCCGRFPVDKSSIRQLRERLIPKGPADTPLRYFEAFIRTNTDAEVPHSTEILIFRRIR